MDRRAASAASAAADPISGRVGRAGPHEEDGSALSQAQRRNGMTAAELRPDALTARAIAGDRRSPAR